MSLPGGQSGAGRRCRDLCRAGTTSPLIPGRVIRHRAGPCCAVPDGAERLGAGIHNVAPQLRVLRASGACTMLWSSITADDGCPFGSWWLAGTSVSGVAEGSMKSPFLGWERGAPSLRRGMTHGGCRLSWEGMTMPELGLSLL